MRRALDILQDETENALGLLRYTNVDQVKRSCVVLPNECGGLRYTKLS